MITVIAHRLLDMLPSLIALVLTIIDWTQIYLGPRRSGGRHLSLFIDRKNPDSPVFLKNRDMCIVGTSPTNTVKSAAFPNRDWI